MMTDPYYSALSDSGVSAGEIDALARCEPHISLLEILALAETLTEALLLASDVHDVDVGNFHFEHQLDSSLHFRRARIATHPEHKLIRLGNAGTLFRHVRPEQHGHQPFLTHASLSSSRRTAPTVATTFLWRARLTGSTALTG